MQGSTDKARVRFEEKVNRRFGTGRYVSAVTVIDMARTTQAQIELLQILEAAFEEIGPVNQFNVSVMGNVRVQLKFNWTQEDRLDVNYKPHKRLIALLDGHRVAGQHVRAEAAEFAFHRQMKGEL